jgi:hypothetical protein
LQHSSIAVRIHGNGLVVFLKEIRPDHTKRGNTTLNGYLFTMERFLIQLHRIVIAPISEIMFVYVTGKVEVGLI